MDLDTLYKMQCSLSIKHASAHTGSLHQLLGTHTQFYRGQTKLITTYSITGADPRKDARCGRPCSDFTLSARHVLTTYYWRKPTKKCDYGVVRTCLAERIYIEPWHPRFNISWIHACMYSFIRYSVLLARQEDHLAHSGALMSTHGNRLPSWKDINNSNLVPI